MMSQNWTTTGRRLVASAEAEPEVESADVPVAAVSVAVSRVG